MKLANNGTADITVFPETEFGIYDVSNKIDKKHRANIIGAAKQLKGVTIFTLTEGNSITKSKEEMFLSSLLIENGEIKGISRKRNLVPFSETKLYSKGKEYHVYDTSFGRIGISICYDINGKTIERLKQNGAQLIVAPFNDSGFGVVYHNIHRYYPIIKAAECAIPIAVANEDGISQVIDHNGKILKELGYGQNGRLDHSIEIKELNSFYLLFGRYIEWILFFGLIVYLVQFLAFHIIIPKLCQV
jgi:apolipoprotein N-acyltransferase